MASRSLNLYTGITNSIYRRASQHECGEIDGFTKRYNINRLVYYEIFHQVGNAIAREKQIKSWTRAKRIALIRARNPTWQDLAEGWGRKPNYRSLGALDEFGNSSGLLGMTTGDGLCRCLTSRGFCEKWDRPHLPTPLAQISDDAAAFFGSPQQGSPSQSPLSRVFPFRGSLRGESRR